MDAVTYPDARVTQFITNNMIPLRVPWNAEPLASRYNVSWTPTLITLDPEGKEHSRTVGYLPPEELVPSLLLGTAKWYFDTGRYDRAMPYLDQVLAEYPSSDSAPEAIYLRGVDAFEMTHDAANLKGAYERLAADYPANMWTKRASPYSML